MGDFWQTTAQLFGSLFEKPKMMEKLLVKPPFKYIFDIVSETTKATGFGNGLYTTEELNPETYSQKESKIIYLKKMIDLVQLMTKQELAVKPNKVVAGLEPENTNIFLQEVYKAAVSGADSTPFVKKVLSKFAKMAEDDQEEKKDDKKPAQKEPEPPKKEEPAKKPANKPEEKKLEEVKKPIEQPKSNPIKKQDSFEKTKKEEPPAKKEEPPAKKPVSNEAKPQPKKEPVKEPPQEVVRPGSASKKAAKIKTNVITQDQKSSAKGDGTSGVIMDKKVTNEDEDMTIKEENSTNYKAGSNFEGKGKFTKETLQEEKENLASETIIKKKEEEAANTIKMGKIGLNKKKDDPSKNYYEAGNSNNAGKFDTEGIKKLVQSLCQNTNPLGKSLEFLNDDIDSMNKENEYWKKQYLASKQKYQNELKKTDEELQPLNDKLAELDEQIRDQKGRIQSIRGQIIKNTSTIQNLLYSVVTNK